MLTVQDTVQVLLSLPPRMAREFDQLKPASSSDHFPTCDPVDSRLGSGGGTAHLLVDAWRRTGIETRFRDWLYASRKLMIHGGGQSRRLPAYASAGKPFIPMPVMRWSVGQRLDQTLLDLQLPGYRQLLAGASGRSLAMLASGDVLLRWEGELPTFPDVDVVLVGLWAQPERAQHHGVFFCPRQHPGQLAFALQKPTRVQIRELAEQYVFLVDTGVWLLSERAVMTLLRKCGWDEERQEFAGGLPGHYELYADFGLNLGTAPTKPDPDVAGLTCAVVPLPQGRFYHFGTNRDLIESVATLQNLVLDQTKLGLTAAKPHPDQHTQNSTIQIELTGDNRTLWIENSRIPAGWLLAHDHVLTNVPENKWNLLLEPGVCLDFPPMDDGRVCVRAYGMDDAFRGAMGEAGTLWFGRPVGEWFASRGITLEQAGIRPETDIQEAPLFPVLALTTEDGPWLEWLYAVHPRLDATFAQRWLSAARLSAAELAQRTNLAKLAEQRKASLQQVLLPLAQNHKRSVFYKLDLQSTADLYADSPAKLPPPLPVDGGGELMKHVHDAMFRAAVLRGRKTHGWEKPEAEAFTALRELILSETECRPVRPTRQVLEDQIIWGRSPVRLDLAGGWTDTPPYCLQYGGKVVNLAVNLNGQPPIQVFARLSDQPELVIRSIDLGIEERVRTYADLQQYEQVGSGFAVAKAALALAGFLPRFLNGDKYDSLEAQLKAFGGGIDVALLSAVPKGSGLGTSSILAATLLGTLSELCGLNWDTHALSARTLALEQMLTTGGGWQDQIGGLLHGIKLIETQPGLSQKPTIRWLPGQFFAGGQPVLLYYTGLTRVAKGILQEIVRGMFLNSRPHLEILNDIGANALRLTDALQRQDWNGLTDAIRSSWTLNQRLDAGTNPPAVQTILDQVSDHLDAMKLLGAGGGGYMLMFAKDDEAARRIRKTLTGNPPNAKARFVNLSLSETGFQVTRS
jgi:galactokinase/mevalonate kinase-like predicted kinase